MSELYRPIDADQPDDARPDEIPPQVTEYAKGDVLAPEWGEAPPWFGYIGVVIAIVSMLIGIAAMVWFGFLMVQWFKS